MISEFIAKKLGEAKYKLLRDGTYFGEISSLKGVWSNSNSLEVCRKELQEVLEDWLLLKVRSAEKIPGFKIRIDKRELVKHA